MEFFKLSVLARDIFVKSLKGINLFGVAVLHQASKLHGSGSNI
jgi:hypothetical protein